MRRKEDIAASVAACAQEGFTKPSDAEAWCRKKFPSLFVQAGAWDVQEKLRIGFGTVLSHWAGLRNSSVVKHLQRLFTLCVCAGFADMEFAKKHPVFWKRALADIKTDEFDAFDITGEIFGTINVVWNAVRDCFVLRSFTPLLGSSSQIREVELEMATLDSLVAYYCAGTLERITGVREAYPATIRNVDFVTRVDNLAARLMRLHKAEGHAPTRIVLSRYLQRVNGHQAQIREQTSRETMRMAPYPLKLDSTTAVGKSVIQPQLMRDCLKIAGYPHTDQHICYLDTASKHWDSYTNITQGVIIDDAQNTVVEYQKLDENSPIIRICNNAKTPVPKAKAEEKGGVYIDAKVLIVSTNVRDLNAAKLSNEPSSQMRRFKEHIGMEVKEGYATTEDQGLLRMLDPTKVGPRGTPHHLFTVRHWVPLARTQERPTDKGVWKVVAGPFEYGELLEYLRPRIIAHFENERRLLEDARIDIDEPLCAHGFTTAPFCHYCRAEAGIVHNPQAPTVQAGEGKFERFMRSFSFPVDAPAEEPPVVLEPTPAPVISEPPPPVPVPQPSLREKATVLAKVLWFKWFVEDWQPPPEMPERPRVLAWFETLRGGTWSVEETFLRSPQLVLGFAYGVLPIATGMFAKGLFSMLGVAFFGYPMALFSSFMTAITVSRAIITYVRCRIWGMSLSELQKRVQKVATSGFGQTFLLVMAGAAMAWTLSNTLYKERRTEEKAFDERSWHERRNELEREIWLASAVDTPCCAGKHTDMQGGCVSTEVERTAPAQPDQKPREHMHERRDVKIFRTLPGDIRTMTYDQAASRIDHQQYRMSITYESGNTVVSNALAIATNYAIAPAHNFLRPDGAFSPISIIKFAITTADKGPVFKARIHPNSLYRLPGDLMLIQTNTGGTMQDLTTFLPDKCSNTAMPIVEHYRQEDMEVAHVRYMAHPARVVSNEYGWSYDGYRYMRPTPTFKGLCGALLIVPSRWPLIIAMHTMGLAELGEACPMLREDVLEGMRVLRETGVVGTPSIVSVSSELVTASGLEHRGEIGELAAKSVLRTVPIGAPFMPVGTLVNVPAKHEKTRLARSPISALVEEVCGEPCQHGPPKNMGRVTEEIRKLQEYDGIMPLPPGPLKLAAQDMYDELDVLIEASGTSELLVPLSEVEAVSGVPGCHSINAINLSTSAGFPRVGNKKGLVVDCPQPGAPDAKCLNAEMRAEVAQLKEQMGQLVKPNIVFTWCQKDEAVKLTKEKVRVFEGAPFALTVIFRQLFLPIFRVLYSELQPWTESAVGINATGPEWDGLARHLMAYNLEKLFVADWIHYDTSLHYQEIMTLFTIWIKLAIKWSCYTDLEIACMWVLAEIVARHMFIVKTDVAVVEGSNPSGNGGTVVVNNGSNGLRERSAFYALAPADVPAVPIWHPVGETMSGRVVDKSLRGRLKPLQAGLKGRYADYVRSIFYGDDLLCAVREPITEWFNQITVSEWFGLQGKGMTGADKLPITQPFTRWCDADFLKRKFRMDCETEHIMAPLALTSIYKSLHVWPRQLPMAPEVHAADVLSGALRELFQHGREEYNARAPALLEVAERVGALPYMTTPSFDERLREWLAQTN